jgi:hypothetical protein
MYKLNSELANGSKAFNKHGDHKNERSITFGKERKQGTDHISQTETEWPRITCALLLPT